MAKKKKIRRSRRRVTVVGDPSDSYSPLDAARHALSVRLGNLMHEKAWNQAELARQATMHGRIAVTRDNISNYVRGHSLPGDFKLEALAAALEVEPTDLVPSHMQKAVQTRPAPYRLENSAHNPKVVWLQVNRFVYAKTGAQVIALLQDDDAPADGT